MKNGRVVFVGQGPNQRAWEHGLLAARRLHPDWPQGHVEDWAVGYCTRVAVTGAVGSRLGRLLGISLHDFFTTYRRRNLNPKWLGKRGRGDAFDSALGDFYADLLAQDQSFDKFVLLGRAVADCFGVRGDWLEVRRRDKGLTRPAWFLIFPHPSGLSAWWNDYGNRERAAAALKEFVA